MKILHICPFMFKQYGGIPRIVEQLVADQTDMQVWTLPYMRGFKKLYWLIPNNPFRDRTIKNVCNNSNADIIHVHPYSCLNGALQSGKTIVYSMHGVYPREDYYKGCAAVIIPRHALNRYAPFNSVCIPHVTNLPVLPRNEQDYLLYVGRADYKKGIGLVLAQAKQFFATRFYFDILPGNASWDRRFNLRNVTVFRDPPDSTISIHYSQTRRVLIPSITEEGFCLVAAEAHKAGCPIEFLGTVKEVPKYWNGTIEDWREEYRKVYGQVYSRV